jgi:hypothetical protein
MVGLSTSVIVTGILIGSKHVQALPCIFQAIFADRCL